MQTDAHDVRASPTDGCHVAVWLGAAAMAHAAARSWLASAGHGHCGETNGLAECASASTGSFGWRSSLNSWHGALAWCSHACHSCERCRYISLSLEFKDCSWYHSCALGELHRRPNGVWDAFLTGLPLSSAAIASLENVSLAPAWPRAALRAQRDALRLQGQLPWLQPHASMSLAVVMFGKIGTFEAASATIEPDMAGSSRAGGEALYAPMATRQARRKPQERARRWREQLSSAYGRSLSSVLQSERHRWQVRLVEEAHRSFMAHVVEPNPRVRFECFAHSWNPSLGPTIDKLYAPLASKHETERTRGEFGSVVVKSALASIRWALTAKIRHERRRGASYDVVMLMRHDLAFHSPIIWERLPRAQLWAVAQCCPWKPSPVALPALPQGMAQARAVSDLACLGSGQGEPMDYCRVSRVLPAARSGRLNDAESELNYMLNDWLLIGPSATLDTLRGILPRYSAYVAALDELGIYTRWLHFFLATHVHDALGASDGLRGAMLHVSLMRHAKHEGCYVNTSVAHLLPSPSEPLYAASKHLCPMRGAIRCHFHSLKCALLRDSPVPHVV